MDINKLGEFLKEHGGFELRRPKLEDPKLSASITIGDKHYQYYGEGEGRLYAVDAHKFASELTHNGQTGRLLTLRCKNEEDKVSAWIQSVSTEPVEAWIGASDEDHETSWQWLVNGNKEALQSETTAYSNWRGGEPNNAGGNEDCATIVVGQGWNDVSCQNPSRVIVEFGPSRSSECEHVITDAHGNQQIDL